MEVVCRNTFAEAVGFPLSGLSESFTSIKLCATINATCFLISVLILSKWSLTILNFSSIFDFNDSLDKVNSFLKLRMSYFIPLNLVLWDSVQEY